MHLHPDEEFVFYCSAEDTLESELMRELENGRLVRLLTKFGFINERPECVLAGLILTPFKVDIVLLVTDSITILAGQKRGTATLSNFSVTTFSTKWTNMGDQ